MHAWIPDLERALDAGLVVPGRGWFRRIPNLLALQPRYVAKGAAILVSALRDDGATLRYVYVPERADGGARSPSRVPSWLETSMVALLEAPGELPACLEVDLEAKRLVGYRTRAREIDAFHGFGFADARSKAMAAVQGLLSQEYVCRTYAWPFLVARYSGLTFRQTLGLFFSAPDELRVLRPRPD